MAKRCAREHDEQVAVVEYARARWGALRGFMIYAIPNGGSRHPAEAIRLRAEGVLKGIPDLCIPYPRGPFHGLYIEMKRRKGGVVSPEQMATIEALRGLGYCVEICRGADEAIRVLNFYMGGAEPPK